LLGRLPFWVTTQVGHCIDKGHQPRNRREQPARACLLPILAPYLCRMSTFFSEPALSVIPVARGAFPLLGKLAFITLAVFRPFAVAAPSIPPRKPHRHAYRDHRADASDHRSPSRQPVSQSASVGPAAAVCAKGSCMRQAYGAGTLQGGTVRAATVTKRITPRCASRNPADPAHVRQAGQQRFSTQ
jgi:hypothetical protein